MQGMQTRFAIDDRRADGVHSQSSPVVGRQARWLASERPPLADEDSAMSAHGTRQSGRHGLPQWLSKS